MKLKHLTTSALALILIAGCGDDDPMGVEPDDIAGTWTATSMLFTSVADNTVSEDIIVNDIATLVIVFDADGTYSFTFTFPPDPDENETGTYSVSGSTLTATPKGGVAETSTIARDGNTMTLTDTDDFDFEDGNGDVPATLVITLTR